MYNSLYLPPSESSWLVGRSSAACLLISTISSVWRQVGHIGQRGAGRGGRRQENGRTRLTEIVESMLSVREVGGVPPPIAGGRGYMRVAGRSCCGRSRLDRGRSSGDSWAAQPRFRTLETFTRRKFETREEQSFDSMRSTGK